MKAEEIIRTLGLIPLPQEGGFYREVYRSEGKIQNINRNFSTHIYYLITPKNFSKFHRVQSDELFHFYQGDPVELIQISPDGELSQSILGADFQQGQNHFHRVKRQHWQGTQLRPGGTWALLGCTVAPGFEFADFSLGARDQLLSEFPQHKDVIVQLT